MQGYADFPQGSPLLQGSAAKHVNVSTTNAHRPSDRTTADPQARPAFHIASLLYRCFAKQTAIATPGPTAGLAPTERLTPSAPAWQVAAGFKRATLCCGTTQPAS